MAALDAGTTTNEAEDGIMLTTKLLMRGKEGVSLLLGPRGDRNLADKEATEGVLKDASVETTMSQICEFSPDGLLLARTVSKGIELVRTEEYGKTPPSVLIDDIPVERVQKLVWSPLGRFLVTWHKPEAGTPAQTGEGGGGGEMTGNLRVFSASTGLRVAAFPMKKLTAMAWPALQWTANEEFACHMVNNEVRVYEGAALDKGWIGKIKVEGLASMSVSPSSSLPVKIAAFCPESKGRPASVKILQFPQLATAIASKTFYQAQEAHMDWSPNGQAVLIKTHTDVDATGSSYYGSTGLYLLHSDGSYEAGVSLLKEGPVSDAKWSPSSRGFVVICGTMPAMAVLYDMKAKPVFNFGCAHRSVVSWSPHARFLCLAGFGNLAGDMDFWDVNKQKKMGSNNSHCAVVHGWSPDSRFFMTATCAPRMNVHNGIKLFRYQGSGPILELPHEQLFDAKWRPATPGTFPDRPQSPNRVNDASAASGGGGGQAAAKPQAYRPPGSSGRLAAMMRAEREGGGPAKVNAAVAATAQRHLPVGMAPPKESNAAKNKAKKERKKKAEEAEAAAREEMEKLKLKEEASAAAVIEASPEPVDKDKRLKKLGKSLKAIEVIKDKVAAGVSINDDQQAKLLTEDSIRAEMSQLEDE